MHTSKIRTMDRALHQGGVILNADVIVRCEDVLGPYVSVKRIILKGIQMFRPATG